MTSNIGDRLLHLLPAWYQSGLFLSWQEMISSNMEVFEISFSKQLNIGDRDVVTTNPILERVKNGMHHPDYTADFGNHNYGCSIMFQNNDLESIKEYSSLLTRKEVLDSKLDGIQVWRSGGSFRNV